MGTTKKLEEFSEFRQAMNRRILAQQINRFFKLNAKAYEHGTLNSRAGEVAELAASLMLRCDDCISYHVIRCWRHSLSLEGVFEVFSVGLVVGGSIVILRFRRAEARLDELEQNEE
ncbi:MAG: carboxymuconolactone decarboxylase family protein [Planctomycetes bacterium]|nr:carboxymuconolactone decarboxylase family protein [Planctomycetota bacterium]